MKWNKHCALIILLISITFAFAQVDSLLVESDSLSQPPAELDSLMVVTELDSLDAAVDLDYNKEEEAE